MLTNCFVCSATAGFTRMLLHSVHKRTVILSSSWIKTFRNVRKRTQCHFQEHPNLQPLRLGHHKFRFLRAANMNSTLPSSMCRPTNCTHCARFISVQCKCGDCAYLLSSTTSIQLALHVPQHLCPQKSHNGDACRL